MLCLHLNPVLCQAHCCKESSRTILFRILLSLPDSVVQDYILPYGTHGSHRISLWWNIDKISFMSESELTLLDLRLRQYKNRNKVYGGFSVIFCDNFRQLQSNGDRRELLYSRDSQRKFESNLNEMIILENKHRFKDDPEYDSF